MPVSHVLGMEVKVTKADVKAADYAFNDLAMRFEKNVGNSLKKALDSGMDEKRLAGFEKRARKIQHDLLAARTREERKSILAREKSWQDEYRAIAKTAKRRLKYQKEAKEQLDFGLAGTAAKFGESLGSAVGDALDLNISGLMGKLKGFGEKMSKAGSATMGKGQDKAMGKLAVAIGYLTKKLGKMIGKMALMGGVFALVVAGIMKVMNHGAKMNKAVMEGGAAFGDLASEGKTVFETLKDVRDAFKDVGRNMEWMQTGEEQLKILGAWSAAGYTVKEMAKGLKTAEERMKAYRKATETATVYATLLGMSTDEIATSMAGYMDELGMSLDGVREKFAQVYQVATESGFGTKRFFGMVLQATSGMAMYNVRLNETAGLLSHLGKILGQRRAEKMLGEAGGGAPTTVKDAMVGTMKRGKGLSKELVKTEAGKVGRGIIERLGKTKGGVEGFQKVLAERGIKIDTSSGKTLAASIGKMSADEQIGLIGALKSSGMNDELIRQFEQNFDLFRGAMSDKLGDISIATANLSPQGQIVASLNAVKSVIKTDLSKMTDKQLIGYQEMTGKTLEELKQLRAFERHSKATHKELKGLQKQYEEGKRFTKEEQKKQIEAFGAYINKNGERIIANTPTVLDKDEMMLGEYEEQNRIGNDLLEFQTNVGAAHQKEVEEELNEQLEVAKDIRQHTVDQTKRLDILKEALLNEVYDAIMSIYYFLSGKDAKEEKIRKQALDMVDAQKESVEQNLMKLNKDLSKTERALASAKTKKEKERLAEEAGILKAQIAVEEVNKEELTELSKEIKQMNTKLMDRNWIERFGSILTGNTDELRNAMGDFMEQARGEVKKGRQVRGEETAPWMKAIHRLPEEQQQMFLHATDEMAREMRDELDEGVWEGWSKKKQEQEWERFRKSAARELMGEGLSASQFKTEVVEGQQTSWVGRLLGTKAYRTKGGRLKPEDVKEGSEAIKATLQEGAKLVKKDMARGELQKGQSVFRGHGTEEEKWAIAAKVLGVDPSMAKKLQTGADAEKIDPRLARMMSTEELGKLVGMGLPEADQLGFAKLKAGAEEGNINIWELREFIEADEETQARMVKEKMAWEAENLKKDQRFFTQMFENKSPEAIADALEKMYKKREKATLTGMLQGLGWEGNASAFAAELVGEEGNFTSSQRAFMKKHQGTLSQAGGWAAAHLRGVTSEDADEDLDDFIWRPGHKPVRVSSADVITGRKGRPGGGGSGDTTVINHYYNDSKSFAANEAQVRKAYSGYA